MKNIFFLKIIQFCLVFCLVLEVYISIIFNDMACNLYHNKSFISMYTIYIIQGYFFSFFQLNQDSVYESWSILILTYFFFASDIKVNIIKIYWDISRLGWGSGLKRKNRNRNSTVEKGPDPRNTPGSATLMNTLGFDAWEVWEGWCSYEVQGRVPLSLSWQVHLPNWTRD